MYKTTKYALPLFFLAVKTNVGYSVVAEFVVQYETKAAIKQGLETIQDWMKREQMNWKPKYFMTDFSCGDLFCTAALMEQAELSYT